MKAAQSLEERAVCRERAIELSVYRLQTSLGCHGAPLPALKKLGSCTEPRGPLHQATQQWRTRIQRGGGGPCQAVRRPRAGPASGRAEPRGQPVAPSPGALSWSRGPALHSGDSAAGHSAHCTSRRVHCTHAPLAQPSGEPADDPTAGAGPAEGGPLLHCTTQHEASEQASRSQWVHRTLGHTLGGIQHLAISN